MSRICTALHLYLRLGQVCLYGVKTRTGGRLTARKMSLEMLLPLEILATVRTKDHPVDGCREV